MPQDRTAAPVGAPLREAKQAMRTAVAAARDALDPGWRARASAALVERIAALSTYAAARTVLLTAPFRTEWDAGPLIARSLAAGKTVVLPRVDEGSRMLELKRVADPERDIVAGYRGLPEPDARCERVAASSIDWVLVPGIAFDRSGGRLGYGGGYYDRTLAALRARGGPLVAIGIAYACGLLPPEVHLPEPHDMALDEIVTEKEVVVIGR